MWRIKFQIGSQGRFYFTFSISWYSFRQIFRWFKSSESILKPSYHFYYIRFVHAKLVDPNLFRNYFKLDSKNERMVFIISFNYIQNIWKFEVRTTQNAACKWRSWLLYKEISGIVREMRNRKCEKYGALSFHNSPRKRYYLMPKPIYHRSNGVRQRLSNTFSLRINLNPHGNNERRITPLPIRISLFLLS